MSGQTTKSSLAGKLGNRLRQAIEDHLDDPLNYGSVELPAGIEGGIAELVDCRFGVYQEGDHKGQPFFMAAGTVISPDVHNGVPVAGLRTQIGPEPICDTPNALGKRKTLSDHVGYVMGELRKLGAEITPDSDLESVAAALVRSAPRFRFRTWKSQKEDIINEGGKWFVVGHRGGRKGPFASEQAARMAYPFAGRDPRVNHQWNGVVSTVPSPNGQAVQDETDDLDSLVERANNNDSAAQFRLEELASRVGLDSSRIDSWEETAAMIRSRQEGPQDLDSLAAAAEQDDASAQESLNEMARSAGLDPDEYSTWSELVDALRGLGSDGDGDGDEDHNQPSPGDSCRYKPLLKTGKRSARPVECEILSVNAKQGTANLRNYDDGTVYKEVSLDDLEII